MTLAQGDSKNIPLIYSFICPKTDSRIVEIGFGIPVLNAETSGFPHNPIFIDAERLLSNNVEVADDSSLTIERGEEKFGPGDFDFVILHDVIDQLSPRYNAASVRKKAEKKLLQIGMSLLSDGGMLALCCRNLINPSHLSNRLFPRKRRHSHKHSLPQKQSSEQKAIMTYWGYLNLFRRVGFRSIRAYNVIPNHMSPLYVISKDSRAARVFFNNAIQGELVRYGLFDRVVHNIMLTANVHWFLESSFLFVAEK